MTQTGGRNGRTERPRRRATCHFRKIHIREMLKSLLAMNRLKDCVLLEFARHVAFYLRVILRCSEFGLVDFVFFLGVILHLQDFNVNKYFYGKSSPLSCYYTICHHVIPLVIIIKT